MYEFLRYFMRITLKFIYGPLSNLGYSLPGALQKKVLQVEYLRTLCISC